MSTEEIINKVDHAAGLVERMIRWQVAIITATACGVLWGARLEWNQGNLAAQVAKIDNRQDKLTDGISGLKIQQARIKQKIGMNAGDGDSSQASRQEHGNIASAHE